MFYCKNLKVIDNNSSYLDPQRVFSGNYWDEFGLSPYLVPENGKILMLGSALGGGIRPALSSSKTIHLTCVDLDSKTVERCRQIYRQSFPGLKFRMEVADAKEYVTSTTEKFDLIWLDIYEIDSYCQLYFDSDFIKKIQSCLSNRGVLAVNAYGIPNQFKPLEVQSAQRAMAGVLQSCFPFVAGIPFRRNITFLCSEMKPQIHPADFHSSLSNLDKKTFVIQGQRLKHLKSLPAVGLVHSNLIFESKFSQIDSHMRQGWIKVLKTLENYQIKLNHPYDLLSFIQNKILCSAFLDEALTKKESVTFIPILAAGESQTQNIDVAWLFDWFLENHEKVLSHNSVEYYQIWLPQLWFLVLHPSAKYRPYCFRVFSLFEVQT